MTASYKIALALAASVLLAAIAVGLLRDPGQGDGAAATDPLAMGSDHTVTDPVTDRQAPADPQVTGEARTPANELSLDSLLNRGNETPGQGPEQSRDVPADPPTRILYSEGSEGGNGAGVDMARGVELEIGRRPPSNLFAGEPNPLGGDPLENLDARRLPDAAASATTPTLDDSTFIPPAGGAVAGDGTSTTSAPDAPPAASDAGRRLGPSDPVQRPNLRGDSAEPPAPAPRPEPELLRLYTIESGDSFSSIALATYGEATKWVEIAQANPLVDPSRLRVGQEIRLPKLAGTTASAGNGNSAAAGGGPAAGATDSPARGTEYVVKAGDSLSSIAKAYYSAASKWELLYQANRRTIGNDPANLKVGMKLIIPPPDAGAN